MWSEVKSLFKNGLLKKSFEETLFVNYFKHVYATAIFLRQKVSVCAAVDFSDALY